MTKKIAKKQLSFVSQYSQLSSMFLLSIILGFAFFLQIPQKAYGACAIPVPTTATGYEQLIRGSVNDKLYRGDLGRSVTLPNGKVLWVFGDTLIGTESAERLTTFIHNSALLTESGCISALTGPFSNGQETTWIVPNATTDVPNVDDYYWASTPFVDGSTLRMFLSHMYNDASGFHGIGVDLASFKMVNGSPVLNTIVKTPGSDNGSTAPSWGAGIYRGGGYTYIFGTVYTNTPWVWGHDYYLARVPNGGQILTPSNWRYWNGSVWVTNEAQAAIVISGTAGVGSGITVHRNANNEYVLVTKKFDMIGSDIVAFKATNLTGPWTEASPSLLTIPALNPPMSSSDFTYLGLGHPQITLSSGKLLVNWSVGSSDFAAFGDPRSGVYFGEVTQP